MSVTEDPKGTEQAQVIAPETPEGKEQVSSEQPKTHTQEQVNMAVHQARSADGRTAKAFEAREEAVKAAEQRVAQAQKDRDEAELEDARDDSEKLTVIQSKHKLRDAKAELAQTKLELGEEREKGKQRDTERAETNREINVFEIATKHTVDESDLKRLSKLTDGSTEAIEAIAQSMVKKGTVTPLTTDSGKTKGGSASFEQIRDDMIKNPSDDTKMRRYMEAKKEQQK